MKKLSNYNFKWHLLLRFLLVGLLYAKYIVFNKISLLFFIFGTVLTIFLLAYLLNESRSVAKNEKKSKDLKEGLFLNYPSIRRIYLDLFVILAMALIIFAILTGRFFRI